MSLDLENEEHEPLRPREVLNLDFLDSPEFHMFDQHDRSSVHQIAQHLHFLDEEKARKLIKYLGEIKGYGL
mgnify:CR=1 FL=1